MFVPKTKVASTRALPSNVVDWTLSRFSMPAMADSMGAVTPETTASGLAAGYSAAMATSGNSISGNRSTRSVL